MVKVITFSVAVVLAIGSGAFAQAGLQYQSWDLGLSSGINLSDGTSAATTAQGLQATDIQNLTIGGGNPGFGTGATQGFDASLLQTTSTNTVGTGVLATGGLNTLGNGTPVNGLTFSPSLPLIGLQTNPTLQYFGVPAPGGITAFNTGWNTASYGGLSILQQ